jgi:dipeptidyl aminopeptidase/acylaminoacyl peptidase
VDRRLGPSSLRGNDLDRPARIRLAGLVVCSLCLHASGAPRHSPSPTPPAGGAAALSVPDLIGMRRFGSDSVGDARGGDLVRSPDGVHTAVVVQAGNLRSNTRRFALLLFAKSGHGERSPPALATFESRTNEPGISQLTWLSNSQVAFLGEDLTGIAQVYLVELSTRRSSALTNSNESVNQFGAASGGRVIVYSTTQRNMPTKETASLHAHGFVIPRSMPVSELVEGDWRGARSGAPSSVTLHVRRGDTTTIVAGPEQGKYGRCDTGQSNLSIAPSGDVALLSCRPDPAPESWNNYTEKQTRRYDYRIAEYPWWIAVDLNTGEAWPLTGGPRTQFAIDPLWAADGRSVILVNELLPLEPADAVDRATRANARFTAELNVRTRAVRIISNDGSLQVQKWDADRRTLTMRSPLPDSPGDSRAWTYRKTASGWIKRRAHISREEDFEIRAGGNDPWKLVRVSASGNRPTIVLDPNKDLLAARRLAQVSATSWTTREGAEMTAGLYFPLHYEQAKRYPVLIQTHGFDESQFSPDGYATTGYAAQPLAGAEVLVVQVAMVQQAKCGSGCDLASWGSMTEGQKIQDAWETLIDHLVRLGLIDKDRVGLQGYSHSCYEQLYFLTQSRYRIAAMTCADGVDGSYMQYMLHGVGRYALEWWTYGVDGGPPFGDGLKSWLERAPGFRLDRIHTPVRLTALTSGRSILEEWEPFAGLILQGKPVELFYLPDASHTIVKPWERFASQQGTVDWFRFWFQGYERTEPVEEVEETPRQLEEQYLRWERLCDQQKATNPDQATFCVPTRR